MNKAPESTLSEDIIIAGAGLSGLLTAWYALEVNPKLSIHIIELSHRIAGDHTWSFNRSDIRDDLQDFIAPFIAVSWPKYEVRFPARRRELNIPYCTGNSATLRACVQPFIEAGRLKVSTDTKIESLTRDSVTLANGAILKAGWVLDARGFEPRDDVFLGYQKFVGRVIETKKPHGLKNPIIMDATVPQLGGYRFVYCLPYSEHEILVEDTYYTDDSDLPENEIAARLDDYINAKGWGDHRLLRSEKGVLPITLAVDEARFEKFSHAAGRATPLGIRAGYYHAVTGYSFPQALKSAWLIGEKIKEADGSLDLAIAEMDQHEFEHYADEKFLRLLNRMLFRAAKPGARYKVLQRFYGLREGLIRRFYAQGLTKGDKLRILAGKPPVPIHKALENFSESAFIARERARPLNRTP
jgi:lycopene beta-cyclase